MSFSSIPLRLGALFLVLGTLVRAQGFIFSSFDVVVYPEYYYPGVMVEIDGEVLPENLPVEVKLSVPADADSVFFIPHAHEEAEAEIEWLEVRSAGEAAWVELNLTHTAFRVFVFAPLIVDGSQRSLDYVLQLDQSLKDVHLVVQEPLGAEGFTFSEPGAETFDDQHGMKFHRVHLTNLPGGTPRSIRLSYANPSGLTSMARLQQLLGDGTGEVPAAGRSPAGSTIQRHKLPLWQPLAVLGVLAVLVSWFFQSQRRREVRPEVHPKVHPKVRPKGRLIGSPGDHSAAPPDKLPGDRPKSSPVDHSATPPEKFPEDRPRYCTSCGEMVRPGDKFCSHCGAKI